MPRAALLVAVLAILALPGDAIAASPPPSALPPATYPSTYAEQLFIRNATGLVRGVRPLSSLVINYIVGSPVQVLGAGLAACMIGWGTNQFTPMLLLYRARLGLSAPVVEAMGKEKWYPSGATSSGPEHQAPVAEACDPIR